MKSTPAHDDPTEKLSILHIDTEPTLRGGQRQVLYLLKGLIERGFAAELVARAGSPLIEEAVQSGVPVHPLISNGKGYLSAVLTVTKLLRSGRFDIVHTHASHAHGIARFACMFCPRVELITTRRVVTPIKQGPVARWKYGSRTAQFIGISEAVRKMLLQGGIPAGKVHVAYSGVDDARFKGVKRANLFAEFNLPPETVLIGQVGHIEENKGQAALIEAAPQICKKFSQVRFLIIGEGDNRQRMEELAESRGVADRIIFTGFRNDVPAVLKALDIFAMPSRFEGLGTAAIEAMMAGLPVVACAVDGLSEVVIDGETGRLVEPGRPDDLGRALCELVGDKQRRERMGGAGRMRALECFSVDSMIEKTIKVYQKL